MNPHIVTTRNGQVWLGDDGVMRGVILPGAHVTLADALEVVSAGARVRGGVKRPLLVDLRRIQTVDLEARVYFASAEGGAGSVAVALLIGSPISRMIGNFFLGVNRPLLPVRLFTDETEALEWLKGFLE